MSLGVDGSVGHCQLQLVTDHEYSTWALNPCQAQGGNCNFAPQPGTSELIYALDSHITQAMYRNGFIWCAQTIFIPTSSPTRCSIQWWEIDPVNETTVQRGLIDDPTGANFYAFPSLAVNKENDVLIGYTRFSATSYTSADYSFHAYNDPPGVTDGDYTFGTGVSPYWKTDPNDSRNRWGDFSRTVVDPVNDVDFLTVQEFAAQSVGSLTNGSGRWGLQWAYLKMTPTNDMFTNAQVLAGSTGLTLACNIHASAERGEPNNFDGGSGENTSVWFAWTAPTTGNVLFQTAYAGSNFFAPLIAACTGPDVSNLTIIANGATDGTFYNPSGPPIYPPGWYGEGSPGEPDPEYQWLAFAAIQGTTYHIVVDSEGGSMGSCLLYWYLNQIPMITTQPEPVNILRGSNVTFASFGVGNPNPSFLWTLNGTNLPGATNSTFTLTNVTTNNTGNYAMVATNYNGSATSQVVLLEVYASATPLLTAYSVSNNQISFTVSGITNSTYLVQATSDLRLTNWVDLYTGLVTYIYFDPSGITNTNYPQRFYRALWIP